MTAAEILVDGALAVEWAGLDAAVQQAARTFFHDTLCVGVAGRNAPNADRVFELAWQWGGSGPCRVLGRPGASLSAPYAAFANAFQIHAQEYDCVHEGAVAHPLATVLAALLAEVDRSGPYDGEAFLAALVAGVDVVAALGLAPTSPLKFFRPATAGIFGSVAAVARLRRLDRETALDAFGGALAYASGTMQAHIEGKPTLALQVAGAARSAIEAIDLAVAGLPGARGSIDGPFGYFALFEDASLPIRALEPGHHRITELSWKPFPTGRAAHGAIVAMQAMRREGLTAEGLDRFTYRAPPLIARLVGRRPIEGMTAPYARLCFAYLGAVTLLRGTVGLEDFDDAALADRDVLALAERIHVEVDANEDPAAFVPAIAIAVQGERHFEQRVTRQLGSPEWPLTRAQHLAKASSCLQFGGLPDAEPSLAALFDSAHAVVDIGHAVGAAFGVRNSDRK